jgi:hypothetical protein
MVRRILVSLVILTLLAVQGCGLILTHYACHRVDPVHGCDDPKDAKDAR